jgi:hypothetical protein
VGDEAAEEVAEGGLAERVRLRRRRRRELLAGLLAEAAGAGLAAAESRGPVRLVPEDEVDAGLDGGVRPAAAEGAVVGVVEAGGGKARAVPGDLAGVRPAGDEGALGLAAEGAAEAPGARLHLEAGGVRGRDDLGHRPAVVGEVVLRDRVQDAGVAEAGECLHVARRVPGDADSEVGAAAAHREGV